MLSVLSYIGEPVTDVGIAGKSRAFFVIFAFSLDTSTAIMACNLVYVTRVSRAQFSRMSALERNSPYWVYRRRVNIEVVVITIVFLDWYLK